MEIDDTLKPVQHQSCRVVVALKPELQKNIDELERKAVLAKVTTPTDWISSMVAVRKPPGKLRICLDPQDLNRALKRPHYPMPTVQEILPHLSNAKVFSILDAKDGFCKSNLTRRAAILRPFGHHLVDIAGFECHSEFRRHRKSSKGDNMNCSKAFQELR